MSLKDKYFIKRVSRVAAKRLLDEYHYLHEDGNYRSGHNYGLFDNDSRVLIGVCVFHTVSAKEVAKGCFGVKEYKLDGFYELGRLCLNPHFFEKNITSFFLGNSIKMFRKEEEVRALLTYADTGHHVGYIYQACNFKYYGLTDQKNDFFIKQSDGSFKKLQRGKCRHLDGEWRPKSQKHRYLIVYDPLLTPIWTEEPYPKGEQVAKFNCEESNKPKLMFIPQESQPTLFGNQLKP
jgi:hypothetical protein